MNKRFATPNKETSLKGQHPHVYVSDSIHEYIILDDPYTESTLEEREKANKWVIKTINKRKGSHE